MKVKLLSRVRLCDPMGYSLSGSSVHQIFQARVLEWVAVSFSRGSSQPRDLNRVSCIAGRGFYHLDFPGPSGKSKRETYHVKVKAKVTQLHPTLCNPMDYTVHGILQARILEWVAFPFSRGSSQPRNHTGVCCIPSGFFTN